MDREFEKTFRRLFLLSLLFLYTSIMATAVLRVDQVNQCGNYIPNQRIPDEIKKCMSMPRDHVPAQLPQVPLEVWQNFWDDYAKQFADYSIYAKELLCCVPHGASPGVEKAIVIFGCLINVILPFSACCVCRLNTEAQ